MLTAIWVQDKEEVESFTAIWLTNIEVIKEYLNKDDGWYIGFVIERPYYTSYLLRRDDE